MNALGEQYVTNLKQKLAVAETREEKLLLLELIEELKRRWIFQARPSQIPPKDGWFIWLVMAGRGFGKTRCAAEWIANEARNTPGGRFALVAATFADAKFTMLEGKSSGLLDIFQEHELLGGSLEKGYNRSTGELFLANGAQFNVYTAEKPRQLRGPQHHAAWCDELAAWSDAWIGAFDEKDITSGQGTTWSNLLFTLRLGSDTGYKPKVVIATTPKPVKLLFDLLNRAKEKGDVHITRGSTNENLVNLSDNYKESVIAPLVGTTTGRQELDAELLEDVKGALWKRVLLERHKVSAEEVPETLLRVVIAVDPATTSKKNSDESGIVVAGLVENKQIYVLEDSTGKYTPAELSGAIAHLWDKWKADVVVAETNQGGDMVETIIKQNTPDLKYVGIHAKRGKALRAEPVVNLYEQGRVKHVRGKLVELEVEMTTWDPLKQMNSPNRIDALVYAVQELNEYKPAQKRQRILV